MRPVAAFTFAELSPVDFLRRSGRVYADQLAVVDGELRFTYREFLDRSLRLTGALAALGIGPGDSVATLCVNSHVLLELHHGVPMRGAVLVPINVRLAPDEIDHILEHSGAVAVFTTPEMVETVRGIVAGRGIRLVESGPESEYERLLAQAVPASVEVADERGLLGINYTSGTTGRPKGVMTHHRGAYLQALSLAVSTRMHEGSAYLWTLPMFHCNGWCMTWAVTAAGGTHVCLRSIDPGVIWRLLRDEGITHFSAAPTVLTMIAGAAGASRLARRVAVQTGGSPPSPTLLAELDQLGIDVTHLYGLTETFGPVAINEWQHQWDGLDAETQAMLRARQGVGNVIAQPLRVVDDNGADVPCDGSTVGEIVIRGNDVMLGYYRDEDATAAVDLGGWFRTGDLAVHHPDGYVAITDRAKDVIISGGENIASVEVERVLDAHPGVLESAVVAAPHDMWGEIPVAFVTRRPGSEVTAEELVAHVRACLAGFKVPKRIVFTELPRTSTGKIQKQVLRTEAAQ